MERILQTNIYRGPTKRSEILELAKELSRKSWPTKVYGLENIEAIIYGIYDKKYSLKRKLGKIEPGWIETDNRDKKLERFLRNYNPNQQLKGGERKNGK